MTQGERLVGEAQRAEYVNRYYNEHVRFRSDIEAWGVEDHWATPFELLQKLEGDCEDFALAKYFTLLALGVPEYRLRLAYVRFRAWKRSSQAHMVLAYQPESGNDLLILDNANPDLVPAPRRLDLQPVFSFNAIGLWQKLDGPAIGDPMLHVPRWRELLWRANAQGLRRGRATLDELEAEVSREEASYD